MQVVGLSQRISSHVILNCHYQVEPVKEVANTCITGVVSSLNTYMADRFNMVHADRQAGY